MISTSPSRFSRWWTEDSGMITLGASSCPLWFPSLIKPTDSIRIRNDGQAILSGWNTGWRDKNGITSSSFQAFRYGSSCSILVPSFGVLCHFLDFRAKYNKGFGKAAFFGMNLSAVLIVLFFHFHRNAVFLCPCIMTYSCDLP